MNAMPCDILGNIVYMIDDIEDVDEVKDVDNVDDQTSFLHTDARTLSTADLGFGW